MRAVGPARRRQRDSRGATSVELAMYMPLLLLVILIAVQWSMVYLGNQAASAVARETARVARATGNTGQAVASGRQYADNIGTGILENVTIAVQPAANGRIRVTVSGQAQKIAPFGVPRVSEVVEGPREEFRRY